MATVITKAIMSLIEKVKLTDKQVEYAKTQAQKNSLGDLEHLREMYISSTKMWHRYNAETAMNLELDKDQNWTTKKELKYNSGQLAVYTLAIEYRAKMEEKTQAKS